MSCLEFCIPFNCCKSIAIEIGINYKNGTFFRLHLLVLLSPFTDPNDRSQISLPFHILQVVKPLPFHIPEA